MTRTYYFVLPRAFLLFLIFQLATVHLLHNKLEVIEGNKTNTVAIAISRVDVSNPLATKHANIGKPIHVFNSWDQERYICGSVITPNSTQTVTVGGPDCTPESSFPRVFTTDPTVSGKHMPPIMVHFLDKKNKNQPHDVECDIPCKVWPTGNPSVRDPAKIDDTPFRFNVYSMEGSGIYPALKVDAEAHKKYRYYATTSFESEVPLPYYSPQMYNIQQAPVDFETAIKGASFLARNCNSFSGRETLLRDLIKQAVSTGFRIDSLSDCMRNALPPSGVDLKNKTEVMRAYLFHFSFENQRTPDYITEKLWGALESGTLPVYFGAPNIKEHVPPMSIIVVDEFSSAKDLVSYLVELSNNEKLYNSYHDWRKKHLPQFFHDKYDFTRVHSYCRVCRFSYAMKYGFGWDHKRQQVRSLKLPRGHTCLDESGRMSSPIRETWTSGADAFYPLDNDIPNVKNSAHKSCGQDAKTARVIPGTSLTRTIWDHDLVTDIEIVGKPSAVSGDKVFWRLSSNLLDGTTHITRVNHLEKSNHDIFWMHDNSTRVVIVFNDTLDSPDIWEDQGTLLVPISDLTRLRVRIIVEEIDKFHSDGFATQNYYASHMIDEFLHPMQEMIGSW